MKFCYNIFIFTSRIIMSIPSKKMLCIISPVRNEAKNLPLFYERLRKVLESLDYDWEILFVHDESKDDTFELLMQLHSQDERIKIIQLSRGFGKENATSAGLAYSRGDATIVIDADLQDPPEVILAFVKEWEHGSKMVYGVRKSRDGESWLKKQTATYFYKVMHKISLVKIPKNTGDFRLLDRVIVDEIKKLKENNRFMKGIFMLSGYRHTPVYYERDARFDGESNFSYGKLINFALDGITGFSTFPLQLASIIGSITLFGSILWILGLLLGGGERCDYLIGVILFFSGVQLITIGILGEYVGRTHLESKQRPLYIVECTFGLE